MIGYIKKFLKNSYTLLNECRQDYAMAVKNTSNSMSNITSCSTILILKAENIHPITNFYKTMKLIKNYLESKHYQNLVM
jgi:hypothetical protein